MFLQNKISLNKICSRKLVETRHDYLTLILSTGPAVPQTRTSQTCCLTTHTSKFACAHTHTPTTKENKELKKYGLFSFTFCKFCLKVLNTACFVLFNDYRASKSAVSTT